MKKDYMLTLSVIEGDGWRPREGSVAVVEARLDGNVVATDPVPLNTYKPKFNTELEWQAHHNTIREYKINRQPIRVECLSVGSEGTSQLLGYIIISIASAVPDVHNEPRWHKLLGGPLESHMSPPGLLLAINLAPIEKQEPAHKPPKQKLSWKSKHDKIVKDTSNKVTTNEATAKLESGSSYNSKAAKEPNTSNSNIDSLCSASARDESVLLVAAGVENNESCEKTNLDYMQNISKSQESLRSTYEVNTEDDKENSTRNKSNFKEKLNEIENVQPGSSNANKSLQESHGADRLHPKLNEEGSYFIIGPANESDVEEFIFAVTIVFAKNLEQMLNVENVGEIYFSYSLLGFDVQTEVISDPAHPEFLAERAAAKIQATPANITEYFMHNPYLPVKLVAGDLCLAVANIGLSQLGSIKNQQVVVEEGAYQLIETAGQSVNHSTDMAVVGVYIQLSQAADNYNEQSTIISLPHHNEIPRLNLIHDDTCNSILDSFRKDTEYEYVEIKDSAKEITKIEKHNERHGIRSNDSQSNNSFKQKYKEDMRDKYMNEISCYRQELLETAALDIEKWKEEQQHLFWKQWNERELQLQSHLSSEWHKRTIAMECKYQERLKLCDKLNEHLNSALKQLHIRQERLQAKEIELEKHEENINLQLRNTTKAIENTEKEEIELLKKHLIEEKMMRSELEKRLLISEKESEDREHTLLQMIRQTKEELKVVQLNLKSNNEQTSNRKDSEKLRSDLSKCIERKQYYKAQWLRAVSDLHYRLKVDNQPNSENSLNYHLQPCPAHSGTSHKSKIPHDRNYQSKAYQHQYNKNINDESPHYIGKETELEKLLSVRTAMIEGRATSSRLSLQEVEFRIQQLVTTEEKLE